MRRKLARDDLQQPRQEWRRIKHCFPVTKLDTKRNGRTMIRSLSWLLLASVAIGCGPPPASEVSNTRMAPGPVDADAATEFTTTESGLKYRIRRKSPDGVKPGPTDNVRVHYKGWLDKGVVFDSSYGKRPLSLDVNQFVPGFGEGLQLIGTGGMIELEIPSRLGYGPAGQGKIPPNATLHFIVELEEVVPSPFSGEGGQ